jgi:zinc/manganese transport system ATP-binding protein
VGPRRPDLTPDAPDRVRAAAPGRPPGLTPMSSDSSSSAAQAAVHLCDVTAVRGSVRALHRITIALPRGRLTGLVGPNGAGKSTLLDLLAGLHAPVSGRIDWAPDLAGRIAWLPQRGTLDTSLPVTAMDTVMLGHWQRLGAFGRVRPAHEAMARDALARVGLRGCADRLVGELSAGQLQRLLFARLMLQDLPVVLLDEPFAAVDQATADDLLSLAAEWTREGRTVILSTHDLVQARARLDHAVLLAGGYRVADGPVGDVLRPDHLAEARERAWATA